MSSYSDWSAEGSPDCPRCSGSHPESDHDATPEEAGISWKQFGPLYHGTPNAELAGGSVSPSSPNMPGVRHMDRSFVTTSPHFARRYADPMDRGTGVVHEVVPHPDDKIGDYDYEIDPNSGPHGWQDAPTIHDAAELASYGHQQGDGISLMFPGRMISRRQFDLSKGEFPH